MNVERLTNLLDVLRGVPDEQFDMRTWWKTNCKTVGCAVGHYVAARPDCGLHFVKVSSDGVTSCGLALDGDNDDDRGDWDAVEIHFDLDSEEADFLFHDTEYENPTRQNVIDRIERFIETDGGCEGIRA